ncbi:HNH endonuclease family protein [Kitasatospora sp. Ki12]
MTIPRRPWRRTATILLALSAALAPAVASPAQAATAPASVSRRTLPEPPTLSVARDELADLPVAEPHSMEGYSRARFPHWATQYGQCDTRVICTVGSTVGVATKGR